MTERLGERGEREGGRKTWREGGRERERGKETWREGGRERGRERERDNKRRGNGGNI
jgi:hypothetical protein